MEASKRGLNHKKLIHQAPFQRLRDVENLAVRQLKTRSKRTERLLDVTRLYHFILSQKESRPWFSHPPASHLPIKFAYRAFFTRSGRVPIVHSSSGNFLDFF